MLKAAATPKKEKNFNFQKLWIKHILAAIDEISNSKVKLLFFLLQEAGRSGNIIAMTTRELAQETKLSLQTISNTLQILEKHEVLKRKTGIIMLNPEIIFKGSHQKRMGILIKYQGISNTAKESEPC